MNNADSFFDKLNPTQLEFIRLFFQNCPEQLLDTMIYKTYPKNHILIHTDDSCSFVYLLLQGRLQAIEEKAAEVTYHFKELSAIEIIGDYELFTGETNRSVTLSTLEKSVCLVIPSADYFEWLKKDTNALFIRTRMIIRQLTEQTRFERHNLFMDNHSRLLYVLYSECQKPHPDGNLVTIALTRAEMASRIGCSVRTINRIIIQLQEEGLLTLRHGKPQLSRIQLAALKNRIDSLK